MASSSSRTTYTISGGLKIFMKTFKIQGYERYHMLYSLSQIRLMT